ncbi:MAG: phage portal protein, partial [Clostridia bacterium]|nr:phage portal protein [Clostridia bacterium]
MGLFNRKAKREDVLDESKVDDVLLRAVLNGYAMSRESTLAIPSVASCVDFICNTFAQIPFKLYKETVKDGKRVTEEVNDDRVSIINDDTRDTLDGFQFKKAICEDYLLGKGGYAYIRKYKNQVTGLFYVPDIYVAFLKNYKPIFKNFTILVEGKEYKHYEFVKLLRRTADGASGIGLLAEVSKALETAYQTLIYQLNAVLRGGSKKGFLKSTRKLGQAEIDVLKNAWQSLYAAGQNNVVVLNEGLEFKEASNSSVELQINESTQTLQAEINNIFRIRPNFYDTFREAIYPIAKAFETALNRD